MEILIPLIHSSLFIMIPLLFAAAGGLFPALCGKLNIALEGMLLTGAFFAITVFHFTGSWVLAVLTAAAAAAALSLIHVYSVFFLKANLFICGLAINLFSGGLCIVLSDKIFNTKGVVVSSKINGSQWFLFTGILLLFVIWLLLYKTPFGLRLRACDKNSEALKSLGISPQFYQTIAFLISGVLCGVGGAFMSLNLGSYVPGMSAGKGWIALVVIFLGGKRPFGLLGAAFVFALAEAFSNYAQGFWQIPADFILAFPYICTFIALIAVSVSSSSLKE